jgi:hypothetical protein
VAREPAFSKLDVEIGCKMAAKCGFSKKAGKWAFAANQVCIFRQSVVSS